MQIPDIHFGTDGWRALAGSQINLTSLGWVAQAFVDALPELSSGSSREIVLGYDGRLDSRELAQHFARIARANQWLPILADRIIPTPVVSFNTLHRRARGGVMITASHNPASYNGIKFKSDRGAPFSTEMTAAVESHLGRSPVVCSEESIATVDLWTPYVAAVKTRIDLDAIAASGLSVVVDSMAGAGGRCLESILKEFGVPVVTLAGDPLPDFGGRLAEPIEQNLKPLTQYLQTHAGFALGLATDGDADRLGVCYENGSWQNAQDTILMLTQYIIETRQDPGDLVKTASVSGLLGKILIGTDRSIRNVQVGFKYIADEMLGGNVAFGAEESGGFGYGIHIPDRDGIFSGLMVMELLARSGHKRLSRHVEKLHARLGHIHYQRVDLPIASLSTDRWLGDLAGRRLESLAGFKVLGQEQYLTHRGLVNGLKLLLEGQTRWILVRSSETEPMVRIYAEGDGAEEPLKLLAAGQALLSKMGVIFKTGNDHQ